MNWSNRSDIEESVVVGSLPDDYARAISLRPCGHYVHDEDIVVCTLAFTDAGSVAPQAGTRNRDLY
jgi:hypothetical protein